MYFLKSFLKNDKYQIFSDVLGNEMPRRNLYAKSEKPLGDPVGPLTLQALETFPLTIPTSPIITEDQETPPHPAKEAGNQEQVTKLTG